MIIVDLFWVISHIHLAKLRQKYFTIRQLHIVTQAGRECCRLPLKATKEDKEIIEVKLLKRLVVAAAAVLPKLEDTFLKSDL